MTDTPKLYPYIVAISFAEGGPVYINAILACNEALATAAVTAEFFQNAGTSKPLMGVSVAQLVPEFLRMALRACEGTLSTDGRTVEGGRYVGTTGGCTSPGRAKEAARDLIAADKG